MIDVGLPGLTYWKGSHVKKTFWNMYVRGIEISLVLTSCKVWAAITAKNKGIINGL